jgi:translation initiation factor IF-1
MATVDITQEQAAVLSAIAQVCEMTGFGRVTVEIRDGKVRMVEISATVLIRRNEAEDAKENPA